MPRKPKTTCLPFDELWTDIVFALDQIFKDVPTAKNDSTPIDVQSYMKAHYACFSLITFYPHPSDTSLPELQNPELAPLYKPSENRPDTAHTHKCLLFYEKLDSYFAAKARTLKPSDSEDLFRTYAAAVKKADRALNDFNRHVMARLRNEGKGGFQVARDSHGQLTEKTVKEATLWGYEKDAGNIEEIQGYIEAGLTLTRIVSINATGLRRFGTEVVEALDLEAALGNELDELEKAEVDGMLKQIGFPPSHRWREMLRGSASG
ncbi:hypothetical protein VNI00_004360 [Paramarasmius palmivorus]|uniref:Uncharacterized protein n=1 Tax=Paramarasmius palmivorus TaxID=297713 RepID=A0AAW0DN43_9AGAR